MKNLFSAFNRLQFSQKLSLALFAIILGAAFFALIIVMRLLSIDELTANGGAAANSQLVHEMILNSVYFIVIAVAVLIAIGFFIRSYFVRYIYSFSTNLKRVIDKTSHGIFTERITNIKYNDDFGLLSWNFNEMIDQLEAFLKEISTSIEYAAEKKYFRKPISIGCMPEEFIA